MKTYPIFVYRHHETKHHETTIDQLIKHYFNVWSTSRNYSLLKCLRDTQVNEEVYVIFPDKSYMRLV